jgi:hypothetical protein
VDAARVLEAEGEDVVACASDGEDDVVAGYF